MSEENNVNSSQIEGCNESKDDSCSVSRSQNSKINFPVIPKSEECKVDSTANSSKKDIKINSSLTPVSKECKDISTTIANSENSEMGSSDNSCTIRTSENSKTNSSTEPARDGDAEYTESTLATRHSETETYSCQTGTVNIEESILKMIKHIEKEIEAEEHVVLNENHFQDIELKIKTSRVMVAIEQAIEKLEIAFCLPWIFVENMNEMNVLCGETNMNKLMNEYCKLRDVEDMDVCRFQPAVINCINDAFEAGFSRFVDFHRNKV